MQLPQTLQRSKQSLRSVPKRYFLYVGALLIGALYGGTFFIPKAVAFEYGGPTCKGTATFLPDLHRANDASFNVGYADFIKVGPVNVFAGKVCFTPKVAPQAGRTVVGTAPFDGPLARTLYAVTVPKTPTINLTGFTNDIPVSKALSLKLSSRDAVHTYGLTVGTKMTECEAAKHGVDCDVPALKLEQGRTYDYAVTRSFKSSPPKQIGAGSMTTLKAVTITGSSVIANATVYEKLRTVTLTADKPIAAATALLKQGDKTLPTKLRIDGTTLSITSETELPREASYRLEVASLTAADGSTLVEPYAVAFATSGGPKVRQVSVGASGVATNAKIIVTFDQPLAAGFDIAPFASFDGGNAVITRTSDTQLSIQLQSLPLCQQFSLHFKKGLTSSHGIVSTADWSFVGRTICHQVVQYGTSLKGRALIAYVFGSGGVTTMYVGGIHGNEPSSTSVMNAWVKELEANPTKWAGKRIVVVPAINPDGLAAGTRTNSRGVNLNRNFPTDNWVKSIKDTDGDNPNGGGESPLSEPEAAALATLTTSYKPRLLLSFHAVGSLVIGDPGGYSAGYAARYASLVGYKDGTNSGTTNFDYNISGAYEDWSFRNAGIPSMVIELSSYTSINPVGHYKALWGMLD